MHMLPLNFGGTRIDKSHTMSSSNGEMLYSNFFGQSSFSSLAIVNNRCLVKVPNETPLELFAPLGCGLQTGAGAILNTLNMRHGASVAVFGTGSVGMAAIMAAKIRKANIIIGIDIDEGRLQIARSLGATHCLNGSSLDIADQIREICDGDGVQYAVDCTGVAVIVERMIDSLGTLGKAATIGAPAPGTKISVDIFSQLTKGRQYIGCNQGDSVPQQACYNL
jgi:Zn-dependent alcohol dehydrogenase